MTEKNYNPEQRNVKAMKSRTKVSKNISKEIIKDIEKSGVPKDIAEKEEKLDEKSQGIETKAEEKKETTEEKPKEKKPEIKKPKKSEAVVNAYSLPLSTKTSGAVCKFIKGKRIQFAISELEQVIAGKKPVPMRGEIPHRHGKGIMSGRYPKKASLNFIKLLRNLLANANYVGIESPVISEAVANIASRPYGKFGRVRRKRTHVKLTAKELKVKEK